MKKVGSFWKSYIGSTVYKIIEADGDEYLIEYAHDEDTSGFWFSGEHIQRAIECSEDEFLLAKIT